MPVSIVCPICQIRSKHPQDIEFSYCGRCHGFHDDLVRGQTQPAPAPAPARPRPQTTAPLTAQLRLTRRRSR